MQPTTTLINWPHIDEQSSEGRVGRNAVIFGLFGIAIVVFFVLELSVGYANVPASSVLKILMGDTTNTAWRDIVLVLRMPRAVTAIFASAALATGGLMMQTLFRNPLAGPWVLGITAGARLGVSVILFLNGATFNAIAVGSLARLGDLSLATGACVGAMVVLLLIAAIARKVNAVTLLIVGLMFQYLAPALDGILAHMTPEDQRETFKMWYYTEFGEATWSQLEIMVAVIVAAATIALLLAKSLNALRLGENYARSMGEHVGRTRLVALVSMVGLSGIVTAFCGPVSFLDLAVPHLCRGIFRTSDHRILMPAVLVTGALVGLAADFILHLPWKRHVFHLDYVTALIGAPVILWIVLRNPAVREGL